MNTKAIKIVSETEILWNVECAEDGCTEWRSVGKAWEDHNGVKHVRTEPTGVRCHAHPAPRKAV